MKADKIVISAKVPPTLAEEIDSVAGLLNIPTRNEFIERAVRLYIGAFRGVERQIATKGGEGLDE